MIFVSNPVAAVAVMSAQVSQTQRKSRRCQCSAVSGCTQY
jgi:hypothetical protein